MGSSCSCRNFIELKEELDILKEQKRNRDFFIDYNFDFDNSKQKEEKEKHIDIMKQNSMKSLSSNDNELIFSTKSYSNIINNLPPIYRIDSYGSRKNGLFEENKNNEKSNIDDKNIIIENDEENNEANIIKEKENNGKNIIIEKNEGNNENKYKTQIHLKPKKIILKNNNENDIIGNNKEGFIDSHRTNIIKNKVIYSCSTDIITNKNYKNDIISEEEYKLIPEDDYSRIIFDYINNLRTNPKMIAQMIEDNKKYITVDENNAIYFKKNNKKLSLFKGYQIFEETINILNNLQPMNKLIYNKNITIKTPDNEDYISSNLEYLKSQVEELKNNGNHISSYWQETLKDPEITFLMMVIDDI